MSSIFTVVLTTAVWVCQPKVKVDDSALAGVVHQNRNAIKQCYTRALKHEPTLRVGKVVTKLEIERSGRVTRVEFEGASRYEIELSTCLSQSIRSWSFPIANGDYEFRFPIVLSGD